MLRVVTSSDQLLPKLLGRDPFAVVLEDAIERMNGSEDRWELMRPEI